ncbi:unnamed protein product, partial [Mesorhabditis spiculigera]
MDEIGWKRRGTDKPGEKRRPFFPRIKHAIKLIPILFRFFLYRFGEWLKGRGVFIDMLNQMSHDPYTGMPLGGIGSGTLGTDYRMAFNSFSILPGIKEKGCPNIKADQFILSVRRPSDGKLLYEKCLTTATFRSKHLSAWDLSFPKEHFKYRSLYPRSWTEYLIPELGLKLVCETFSPIIPHDYKDPSLPVACFDWSIQNDSTIDYDISIAFTFRNGTGNSKWQAEGPCRGHLVREGSLYGVEVGHTIRTLPTVFGIYATADDKTTVSTDFFDPTGDGQQLWDQIGAGGLENRPAQAHKTRKQLGIACCQTFTSHHGTSSQKRFTLVWNMPRISFAGVRKFSRRYTRWFGTDLDDTWKIVEYALQKADDWKQRITAWQSPILEHKILPDWFKSCLLNELYYISDGSTIWVEFDEQWLNDEPGLSPLTVQQYRQYGRFGYAESWEYLMVNTYDVHFYGSWALYELWPHLELGMQFEFSDQFRRIDTHTATSLQAGAEMARKRKGRLPHDVGNPNGEPWLEVNAYSLHDTSGWKDLNLKYVILSYRDYRGIVFKNNGETEAKKILAFFFERSREIIDLGLVEWDIDGDGMIENNGTPDQTYDIWSMKGTSAYCGSLWIVAVECVRRMAIELEDRDAEMRYKKILDRASDAFMTKLWTGSYFAFDETPQNRSLIMADQLCGFWFLSLIDQKACGSLLGELGPGALQKSMATIYEKNLMGVYGGSLGPVNGIRTNGRIDTSSIQSEEIWTGTAYSLATLHFLCGQLTEGLELCEGMHQNIWNTFGMQYQTPEAIFPANYYRAIGYLRPLSVWSTLAALQMKIS